MWGKKKRVSNKTQWIKACFYDNLLSLLTVGRNHSFPDLDNLYSTLHPELNFLPLKRQTGHSLWWQELPFLADHKELFTWRASTKTQTWDIQDFYCLGIYFRFLILADFCTCTILLFPFPKGSKQRKNSLFFYQAWRKVQQEIAGIHRIPKSRIRHKAKLCTVVPHNLTPFKSNGPKLSMF